MDKKPLIIVDVQPQYLNTGLDDYIDDIINHIEKAAKSNRPIVAFYNSEEFSGDTADESRFFFIEQGLSEKSWGKIMFVEKSYGFLRNWMDEGIKDETIIEAVKIMKEDKVYDSRQFTQEHWDRINKVNGSSLFFEDDKENFTESYIVHMPDFEVKILNAFKGMEVEMLGGGRYECLEEMKLFCDGYDIKPQVNEELSYGAEEYTPEHKKPSNFKPK